jgi:hypothetical protein
MKKPKKSRFERRGIVEEFSTAVVDAAPQSHRRIIPLLALNLRADAPQLFLNPFSIELTFLFVG